MPDVNVLVSSVRRDHPHHDAARQFVVAARDEGRACALPVEVLAAALRILTLPVWHEPETSASAGVLLSQWLNAAGAVVVSYPPATWTVLAEFARTLDLRSRAVPDALIAAGAIASRACLVTFDPGLNRFPGLRVETPGPV